MTSRALRPALLLALAASALSLAACGSPDPDPDAGSDAGTLPDGEIPPPDANVPDGSTPDGSTPDGGTPDGGGGGEVTIRNCPAADRPPLASGAICEATAGDGALLITADILTPNEVLVGGQVLVDAAGTIVCADCDCAGAAGAATATRLDCPDGVVSPGLINAHEHLSFQGNPYTRTDERYEHRHDWRRGLRGHTRIGSRMATGNEMIWAELRMVLGGATSLNGSGSRNGFARNLDRAAMEGLGQDQVEYDTFPLGDSDGTLRTSGCDYGTQTTAAEIASHDAYTPHVAEGIDAAARNEFLCMREGANDLVQPNTAMIHGVGLLPTEIDEMSADGAMLIWSPRSNVTLYGDTARVTEYDRLGVPIALGTDWVFTGSMNMLRELSCADSLNADYLGGYFSDVDLWRMATLNGAVATATDDVLGAIVPGRVADLAIFDGSVNALHRAVIDAQPEDVALVLRGGVPLYGEAGVVPMLRMGAGCDAIDVCGAARQVCAMREIGMSLAALTAANASSYPLFFCGAPTNEPSCLPERNGTMAEIMGSTRYTGMRSADDSDGDGIPNAVDLCPAVFDPIRPVDMGVQADADADGVGDACDPCPLDAGSTTCSAPDPDDRDRDGVADTVDNCPGIPNPDQADADGDGKGDACDACPMDANPGAAVCPWTIYDVQDGTLALGTRVSVAGVVTAVASNGFFAQVPTGHPDYAGVDHSGVFVFTGSSIARPARGAAVTVDGAVADYFGETQITASAVTVTGTGTIPAAVMVTPAEVATGGARADALEGVLVRVASVTVTNAMPPPAGGETGTTNEFEVTGGLRVDDFLFLLSPLPSLGETFDSITGVLAFRRSNSKLHPRDAGDVVAGSAQLASLGPALSYARAGAGSAPTFPVPLTVTLTRAVGSATTVTVASSGPGAAVTDVTIPAGSASAPVPVTGVSASATPVTITATLGGTMRSADVRVLGATEVPASFTLTPATATVPIGATQRFTITTDVPAPPAGAIVTLSVDAGGTVPASVTVPADTTTATFDFVAGTSATTATVTATLGSTTRMASVSVIAGSTGSVVINEVDYDMVGTDTDEYVELFNPGITAVDLTGVALVRINGGATGGPAEYGTRVMLSGTLAPGEYLVIASATVTIPAGVRRIAFSGATDNIQNGPTDGLALIHVPSHTLLDALSYEGSITAVTIDGTTYSLVEGTPTSAADSNTAVGSLCRLPNGLDTDDASNDWSFTPALTPGAANSDGM